MLHNNESNTKAVVKSEPEEVLLGILQTDQVQ